MSVCDYSLFFLESFMVHRGAANTNEELGPEKVLMEAFYCHPEEDC